MDILLTTYAALQVTENKIVELEKKETCTPLVFHGMKSMDDFNNTTIDLVDLENMGVPVGISLISCTVHEI
mgnify:CR=1 FL=1